VKTAHKENQGEEKTLQVVLQGKKKNKDFWKAGNVPS